MRTTSTFLFLPREQFAPSGSAGGPHRSPVYPKWARPPAPPSSSSPERKTLIKRITATAAAVAIPALATIAFTASPAAATTPVHPVTPGAYCAADQHLLVRQGPAGRNYQCQDHDGWRWVPTEPCPGASASASAEPVLEVPELRRLIPICFPLIKPSASPSASTSASASASSSVSPSVSPSASSSGGVVAVPVDNAGQNGNLPVTGSTTAKIAALGVAAGAVGALLAWVARKRRTKFVAED